METTNEPMPAEFYATEDAGMFTTAINSQKSAIDEAAFSLVEQAEALMKAIEGGDVLGANSAACFAAAASDDMIYGAEALTYIFSQTDTWALSVASDAMKHALADHPLFPSCPSN